MERVERKVYSRLEVKSITFNPLILVDLMYLETIARWVETAIKF